MPNSKATRKGAGRKIPARDGRLLVAATEGEGKKKAVLGKYSVIRLFGGFAKKYLFSARAARGNGHGAPVGSFAGRFDKDS